MPELPDIQVFSQNLTKLFVGKKLLKIKVINGNKLKDSPKELSTRLEGSRIVPGVLFTFPLTLPATLI